VKVRYETCFSLFAPTTHTHTQQRDLDFSIRSSIASNFSISINAVMGIIAEWFQRKWRLFQKKREERRKRKEKEKRIAEARLSRDSRNIYWGADGNLRSGFAVGLHLTHC
jgi:hypothetical protein